jgi:hypothetical protein
MPIFSMPNPIIHNGVINEAINEVINEPNEAINEVINGEINGDDGEINYDDGEINGDDGEISGDDGEINGDNGEIKFSGFSENEILVYEAIASTPNLTRENLIEKLDIPARTIDRIIKSLKEKNAIERVGSKKAGYWNVIKK